MLYYKEHKKEKKCFKDKLNLIHYTNFKLASMCMRYSENFPIC